LKPYPVTEAFKQSEAKYREFINDTKTGMFRATSDGNLLEVNLSSMIMSGNRNTLKFLNLKTANLHQNPDDNNNKFMKEMDATNG